MAQLSVGISVAILDQGHGGFKHWSLDLAGPQEQDYVVLQITGSSGRFSFEQKHQHDSILSDDGLSEMIHLCNVSASEVVTITKLAAKQPIHNEFPGYNCQDYIIDLLDKLEDKSIIDSKDKKYQKQKKAVVSRQEGFD